MKRYLSAITSNVMAFLAAPGTQDTRIGMDISRRMARTKWYGQLVLSLHFSSLIQAV